MLAVRTGGASPTPTRYVATTSLLRGGGSLGLGGAGFVDDGGAD